MAISDWPEGERPREKLLSQGASTLSDAELLAIFLRTGVTGKSAVDLARELLSHFGDVRSLLCATEHSFCEALGLGRAKYAQLQAVLELSRRHMAESLKRENAFTSVMQTQTYVSAQLRDRQREVFAVLFLDNQHRLIAYEEMFEGTLSAASVYPREIVKRSLSLNAAAIILAHNHPSGVNEPSAADREITEQIKEAACLLDVRLLDHLVVGDGKPVSFAERGWL